ncbi:DUF3604 domain-containing protein [Chelativorans sp. AA-79]|uniref:DUF3604 domain-containing protein n=1 Tax=Chelativorans sp. AA-79 TaxID=3028735 RepID=UPI0023F7FEEF|nr:DUF3604 domain-containing protein [Chelativorans sp. AA-79]WEX12412.1 DUF3604 domain-containing protein [Chelativorans sp. AA-79]
MNDSAPDRLSSPQGAETIKESRAGLVARELVGDFRPDTVPFDDPETLGRAVLSAPAAVTARSFATFRVTYTVGRLGLDDTGAIRIAFRFITDLHFQTDDPKGDNYVSAHSDGEGRLELSTGLNGHRPWTRAVTVQQRGGYLRPGQTITIVFGDTSGGSRGLAVQSFAEAAAEFKVLADVQATGIFVPLEDQLFVPIVAGKADRWVAVMPTMRRPGEEFFLGLRAEDAWGNPTPLASGKVRLAPSRPVDGLPESFEYADSQSMRFEGLSADAGEPITVAVHVDGQLVAEAGPLHIGEARLASYWGDLHGQSGETVGINTVESYFDYARNKAFLDVSSHQGNDFQINRRFWKRLNEVTAEFDEPGRFVAFPGYEWSGNTAVGGDHNVFFRHEGEDIRRCSHALLADRSDSHLDAADLDALYRALAGKDSVMYAHVGGRYANLAFGHDPVLETAVEIHSDWGTFEWMLTDSFDLKRRVGVVANSDSHDARPGASYPGTGGFGAYGGLTCFLAERLDRDAIFEAMRRRHHYATSGCRLHIELGVELGSGGLVFERDPNVAPGIAGIPSATAMMGDIARTSAERVRLSFRVAGTMGIERVEVRNGDRPVDTVRGYGETDLGRRLRVRWAGAEYRGRGRTTSWEGEASFSRARIERFDKIAIWNHERRFSLADASRLRFEAPVAGNLAGFDAWLSEPAGRVRIETNHGTLEAELEQMGVEDRILDAGGLHRCLMAYRLPDEPIAREIAHACEIDIVPGRDNPIWIAVVTENGHQAWTSPVYVLPA